MGEYFADCGTTLDVESGAQRTTFSDGTLGAVQTWADPGATVSSLPSLTCQMRDHVDELGNPVSVDSRECVYSSRVNKYLLTFLSEEMFPPALPGFHFRDAEGLMSELPSLPHPHFTPGSWWICCGG